MIDARRLPPAFGFERLAHKGFCDLCFHLWPVPLYRSSAPDPLTLCALCWRSMGTDPSRKPSDPNKAKPRNKRRRR